MWYSQLHWYAMICYNPNDFLYDSSLAPEVLGKQGYTTKADMWSVGIIMYLVYVKE